MAIIANPTISNKIIFRNIPPELCSIPNWTALVVEPRFLGDEPTKIPYDAITGYRARSNDPSTWTTADRAYAALRRNPRYAGMGFMLVPPYIGVDLDDCRDAITGDIEPSALEIIETMETYAEVSRSGCGIKMIGKGIMPTPDGRGKNYRRDPWKTGEGGIEFYQSGRFFALTGQRLDDSPEIISDLTEPLSMLHNRLYPPVAPRPRTTLKTADVDIATRITRCAKYLDKLPASISGQGGHDRLLAAACSTVRFGLEDGIALDLLHRFNRRANPPWGDRDIERKLSEAHKLAGAEFGVMLQRSRPFRLVMVGGAA